VTLASLTLAACTGTSIPPASPFATETRPAVTAPAQTVEPTKKPTPEPTKIPFAELMPERWQDCRFNDLNPKTKTIEEAYKGLEQILSLENSSITKIEKSYIWPGIKRTIGSPSMAHAPEFMGLKIDNQIESNYLAKIVSCSYMEIGKDQFFIFGVPFRMFPKKNNDITFLHFAINFEASEKMYQTWESLKYLPNGNSFFKKYVSLSSTYSKINNREYNQLYFSYIVGPSGKIHEDYWISSLNLYNFAVEKGLFNFSIEGLANPDIQKAIFPCIDIRVDPIYPPM